jgi:hypothetical protein
MQPSRLDFRPTSAVVLGLVLMTTGTLKLALSTPPSASLVTISVIEVALGVWLITLLSPLAARASSAILFAGFVGYRFFFAQGPSCGCFGIRPVSEALAMTIASGGVILSVLSVLPISGLSVATLRLLGCVGLSVCLLVVLWMQVRPQERGGVEEDSERLRIVSRILSNGVTLQERTTTVILHDSSCPSCTRENLHVDLPDFAEVVDLSLLRLPEDVPERGMLKSALGCLPLVGVVDHEGGKVQVRTVRCLEGR